MSQTPAAPYVVDKPYPEPISEDQISGGNFFSYLHILRKRKWVILASLGCSLLIAFYANIAQKPVYQSSTELILQAKESQTAPQGQPQTSFIQDPTFLITQVQLIRSHNLADRILQKLDSLENRELLLACFLIRPSRPSRENSVFSDTEHKALLTAIPNWLTAFQVERGARIIAISATGYNPHAVALIADAAAQSYIELNHESHVETFQSNFLMLSKSLAQIREKIKTGEIATQKVDSEIQLLEALRVYEEKHPSVIQLRKEIPALAQKLNLGIQNLKGMQFNQRKDLVPFLAKPHIDTSDLAAVEADLYTLKPILEQEVNTTRGLYESMFKKLQEIELTGGSLWVDAKVVENAPIPTRPIRPNKKMNLTIAFLVGLLIGAGLAFFLEYLDSSIRNLDDVRAYLRLFPLGMVPQVEFNHENPREKSKDSGGSQSHKAFWLANDSEIPLYVAEAYRIIRTNLAFGSVDASLKTLQITSAVKGEGKTTTAANLAVSLAQAGIKTLVLDADMRRPSIHRILGLEGVEEGLSEVLANTKTWESVLEPTTTPNLFSIPAGRIPPNPAELLSSKRWKTLLEEFKTHFDMVIIDSPPVVSVADSSVIASRVDGVILVCRSGYIPRHLSLQAKNALTSVNGKVIGCVLNSIRSAHQPYYYYRYYHKYYGDYYGETEKKDRKKKAKRRHESPSNLERLNALQEPLRMSFSSIWSSLTSLLKWEERPKKRSQLPDDLE